MSREEFQAARGGQIAYETFERMCKEWNEAHPDEVQFHATPDQRFCWYKPFVEDGKLAEEFGNMVLFVTRWYDGPTLEDLLKKAKEQA